MDFYLKILHHDYASNNADYLHCILLKSFFLNAILRKNNKMIFIYLQLQLLEKTLVVNYKST